MQLSLSWSRQGRARKASICTPSSESRQPTDVEHHSVPYSNRTNTVASARISITSSQTLPTSIERTGSTLQIGTPLSASPELTANTAGSVSIMMNSTRAHKCNCYATIPPVSYISWKATKHNSTIVTPHTDAQGTRVTVIGSHDAAWNGVDITVYVDRQPLVHRKA